MSADAATNRIIRWIERIAGAILGLVTVLIVGSSIGRYLFAVPIPDAFDLSRLILGVAIIWGFASLGFSGSHIKVDLLVLGAGGKGRRAINAFAWSVLLLFTVLLCWKVFDRVVNALVGGDATMELRLPHWPFFAAIWLGLVAAVFTTSVRLFLVVARGRDLGGFEAIDVAPERSGPGS